MPLTIDWSLERFLAMLLEKLLSLLEGWAPAFRQQRTYGRAIALALGLLCGLGRRTGTRAICFNNRQHQDWSADYKLFNRSRWDARALFGSVIQRAIAQYCPKQIVIGLDDTGIKRSGKKVKTAQWLRDPLSPIVSGHHLLWVPVRFVLSRALNS